MAKKMPYDTAIGIVSDEFKAVVTGSRDEAALKHMIAEAAQAKRQIQDNRADDAQLTAAKEVAKDLAKGYSEAEKNEEAKTVVLLERLKELHSV